VGESVGVTAAVEVREGEEVEDCVCVPLPPPPCEGVALPVLRPLALGCAGVGEAPRLREG
jgi:hypothetical protein